MKSIKYTVCVLALLAFENAGAQKYITESSLVSFFSHAAIEDIKASNKKTAGLFNSSTSEIAFSVPIHEFRFAKSLMQEHFNEKYMESEKFPKATFQGKINNFSNSATGVQNVTAVGKLTIHGVTNDVDVPGTIERRGEKLMMTSKFKVKLQDYKITIPQLLWQNIAEEVEVTLEFAFKPE